jgi:putative glutamine amidotransferase
MVPLIGITTYVECARWGVWDTDAALLPMGYVRAVEAAGGRAVLLPPSPLGASETLRALDGLVFAGGADVDPARYGAQPSPETAGLRPDRDEGELALLRAAIDDDVPVLGVCRGMQLMNVALGGSLQQHLPDAVGHDGHRPSPGVYGQHSVETAPGSRLAALLGEAARVNSYHHQGIASVGEGLTATAHAADGTIEAIEIDGRTFALGVLWHPEVGDDLRLFESLVESAREVRTQ